MKLEKFKRNNKSRIIVLAISAIILIFGGMIYLFKSYALYEEDKTFTIIKGQVPNFSLSDIDIAYTVDGVKGASSFPKKSSNYTVSGVTCQNGATASWDSDTWSLTNINPNGNTKISCSIEFSTGDIYTEEILNGADPVLADNLIPVNISDDGTVTKADITKEWYNYGTKKWANAVILKDETKTYENGAPIPEDNIESYFVWIPKYSYQLWDLGEYDSATEISSWSDITIGSNKQDTINIKFGTTNTRDSNLGECTTPMLSGETGNCEVGKYMTHPAFINANTNGLWVGKFEIGYDGAATEAEAQVSGIDYNKIVVKPNIYSWRNNSVYNFFMASYAYNRNLDSHMMKNTEWGAVVYLSYSEYGKNDEVWINNNKNYMTGCVGDSVSASSYDGCANAYNTTTGYNGSTTGNITGIYDMSGGTWEYMAAYIDGKTASSGFSKTSGDLTTYAKYLDVYNASSDTNTYNYRILGDATGEMGPFYKIGSSYYNNWFQDPSGFVSSSDPWFNRGAGYSSGTNAGRFNFSRSNGSADSLGTRLVLAV
jgi:hypothetical protein